MYILFPVLMGRLLPILRTRLLEDPWRCCNDIERRLQSLSTALDSYKRLTLYLQVHTLRLAIFSRQVILKQPISVQVYRV